MVERQRFKIENRLDAGGMAEVFLGKAISVGGIERDVAIKRILPALTQKPKFARMFLDEARLTMLLTHANIVQVFDVGRSGGTFFIVMEFVDGWNLRRIFSRANELGYRIPLNIACFIMMEVCKGLAHAHEKRDNTGRPLGIVHRDVSPPNILISRFGEVKLVDFGLAKAVTQVELTDPGIVKGKFSYLSPEAAAGAPVDSRADIFSAGTVMFELLSNRQLFRGQSDSETLELVRTMEPPPLSKLNPEVPAEFDAIVRKSLTKDPRRRYLSARELGEDIAKFLVARNLKATAYDLAGMLRILFEESTETSHRSVADRILSLIEEELVNLSSLGELDKLAKEGSLPLDLQKLPSDLPARHNFADLWSSDGSGPALVIGPEAGLSERLEGHDDDEELGMIGEPEVPVKAAGTAPWVWVVLGVAILAVIVAILYSFVL